MTAPREPDLMEWATPYALNAVSDGERADIERRIAVAPGEVVDAFAAEVRAVRETMATLSEVTAVEPPTALRGRILAAIGSPSSRRNRWRTAAVGAAAAAVIVAAGFGAGVALRPTPPPPSVAEQVLGATDVRSVSSAIPAGGTVTAVYSRDHNAAVLVFDNVAPPAIDTVYQMWLLDNGRPRSAGTLDAAAVAPSTTDIVHDLGVANTLALTVEPGTGSEQPTGEIFAQLPLQ
ncbi:anti-sigma factor [Mycobacterium sp. NPDC003449]